MKDFIKLFINPNASIREAISVIDSGASKVGLIVDSDILYGVVTDGDIRRGLLRGKTIDTPVREVMQKNFKSVSHSASKREAFSLMKREKLSQIPVLDKDKKIVNLFLLDEFVKSESLTNTVVIMAGGKGTRLLPLTKNCPKPMLRIGGKPLLRIILEQCIDAGFSNFYFSVNYLKEYIKDYFNNGSNWGVQIRYLEESKPLGTAGSLGLLSTTLKEPILVLNGDILTRVEYSNLLQFHNKRKLSITMCVRENRIQIPYGVIRMENDKFLGIDEKPILRQNVNAGIYVLDPKILKLIPKNTFFSIPQLLEKAATNNSSVGVFPVYEYWLDVGMPETLIQAKGEWSSSTNG